MPTVQHLLLQIGDGSWQDVTLSAENIFFCITFIPMLRQPERPPLPTFDGMARSEHLRDEGLLTARRLSSFAEVML
jgi:hypothetical protein